MYFLFFLKYIYFLVFLIIYLFTFTPNLVLTLGLSVCKVTSALVMASLDDTTCLLGIEIELSIWLIMLGFG